MGACAAIPKERARERRDCIAYEPDIDDWRSFSGCDLRLQTEVLRRDVRSGRIMANHPRRASPIIGCTEDAIRPRVDSVG